MQAGCNGLRRRDLSEIRVAGKVKGKGLHDSEISSSLWLRDSRTELFKTEETELMDKMKTKRFSLGVTRMDRINKHMRGTVSAGLLGDKKALELDTSVL